jgi:alkylation response protein AidB-like acyl-CoA dehydrogenase
MHGTAPVSDLSDERISSTVSRLAAIGSDRRAAIARLLESVGQCVPAMRSRARELDCMAAFPSDDIAALRGHGALLAPLPLRHGGLGLGTEPDGALGLFDLLRLIGSGNLSVGRIFEGHVNALQLICRYGDEAQMARAAEDAASGHLFAIWNTEAPPGVRRGEDGMLTGRKSHGSAAGSATRAIITVDHPDRSRLLLVSLTAGERAGASREVLHGMRATQSGWIDFDSYAPRDADWIGEAGDYLREPAFSAGAWRALAVILGGIQSIVGELRGQLHARGRHANPHQAVRIAQALIAQETAFLWMRKAALLVESGDARPEDIIGYVGLARRAVELAALEVIQLAQRSLGLAALVDTNAAELLMRDLATYLRQPAMDEAIEEAAAHFVTAALPVEP